MGGQILLEVNGYETETGPMQTGVQPGFPNHRWSKRPAFGKAQEFTNYLVRHLPSTTVLIGVVELQ